MLGRGSLRLLIDPYLSDSLTRKYAGTDRPHVRMTAIPVDPGKLGFVNLILSTHAHTDHMDPDTLGPVGRAMGPRAVLVVPAAIREVATERSEIHPMNIVGSDDGLTLPWAGVTIHGVAAAHNEIERDEAGRCRCLGYVIKTGAWTVYHAGDTLRYDGMVEKLKPLGVDVALLPINGNDPARKVAGNLDGPEAARLAKDIGAKLAIPMHYEMFEFNTAPPDAFVVECERLDQPYRVLRCGERWSGGDRP